MKNRKECLYIAFMDFKKGYYTINRWKLFQKLKQAQIGYLCLKNLEAMYSSVKYCVKMTNGYTDPIKKLLRAETGMCVMSHFFQHFHR